MERKREIPKGLMIAFQLGNNWGRSKALPNRHLMASQMGIQMALMTAFQMGIQMALMTVFQMGIQMALLKAFQMGIRWGRSKALPNKSLTAYW